MSRHSASSGTGVGQSVVPQLIDIKSNSALRSEVLINRIGKPSKSGDVAMGDCIDCVPLMSRSADDTFRAPSPQAVIAAWQRHKTRLQQAVERSDEWFETTLAGFVLTVLIVALFLFGLAFGLPAALEVYIR